MNAFVSARPAWAAFALCALSGIAEALFAGRGIGDRLTELRSPRFSLPLWGWAVIAAGYYVICYSVLFRLFELNTALSLRPACITLILAVMAANAFWNYLFFRRRNLFLATIGSIPYSVAAILLLYFLSQADRTAAWIFAPYCVYLIYANVWGFSLWKLNRSP